MSEQQIVIKNNNILTVVFMIFIALIVVGVIYAWKNLRDENIALRNEVVEFKKLTDTLVRSSTQWSTKQDLNDALKNLLTKDDFDALKKDLNNLDARLSAVGKTVGAVDRKIAELEESTAEGNENTNVVTCNDGRLIDVNGYTKKPQIKELSDINKAPVANVQFDASKTTPWTYEVYKKEYNLVTVIGKKEDGQLSFYNKLEYSIPDKEKDKKYSIELLSSQFLQAPLFNQMYWFNPVLDVNIFVGGVVYNFPSIGPLSGRPDSILSTGFDLGLSFSSYGETKNSSLCRFFRLGLGYNSERRAFSMSFMPAEYNLGNPLPLLTNLYLGPQVAVDSAGGLSVNLGLGLQL